MQNFAVSTKLPLIEKIIAEGKPLQIDRRKCLNRA
jgi:hypothetical protein